MALSLVWIAWSERVWVFCSTVGAQTMTCRTHPTKNHALDTHADTAEANRSNDDGPSDFPPGPLVRCLMTGGYPVPRP